MKARFIDLQKSRLIKGEISRRQFIRSALASGVGMTGALSLANSAEAANLPKGGTLRLALRGHGLPFVFGTALTEMQGDGALTGSLAESWTSNAAATEWQFRLRRDVTFHSGAPLTAADTLATLLDAPQLTRAGLITGEAADSDLVSLTFAGAVPDLPLWLADESLVIRPATGAPDGTGPYRAAKDGTILAFERWHRGRAQYDALHFETDATLADLTEGRIGALVGATPDERAAATPLGLIETDLCGLLQVLADARVMTPRGALRDPVVILGPGVAQRAL